jgi:hypothetical protein
MTPQYPQAATGSDTGRDESEGERERFLRWWESVENEKLAEHSAYVGWCGAVRNLERENETSRLRIEALTADNAALRARCKKQELALRCYTKSKWAPVADYADGYWYMSGKPWKAAEFALATPRAPGETRSDTGTKER